MSNVMVRISKAQLNWKKKKKQAFYSRSISCEKHTWTPPIVLHTTIHWMHDCSVQNGEHADNMTMTIVVKWAFLFHSVIWSHLVMLVRCLVTQCILCAYANAKCRMPNTEVDTKKKKNHPTSYTILYACMDTYGIIRRNGIAIAIASRNRGGGSIVICVLCCWQAQSTMPLKWK